MAVNFRRLGLSQESGPRPIGPGSQSRGPRRAEPSPEMDLLSDRKWSRRTSGCSCEGVVCCPNMNPELPQGRARRSSEPPRHPPNVCGVNRKQLLRQPPRLLTSQVPGSPPLQGGTSAGSICTSRSPLLPVFAQLLFFFCSLHKNRS